MLESPEKIIKLVPVSNDLGKGSDVLCEMYSLRHPGRGVWTNSPPPNPLSISLCMLLQVCENLTHEVYVAENLSMKNEPLKVFHILYLHSMVYCTYLMCIYGLNLFCTELHCWSCAPPRQGKLWLLMLQQEQLDQ